MYAIFDIALDCDIPLPELPEVETADIVIKVETGLDSNGIPERLTWIHHWETLDGEVCISFAKTADTYILRFPELVDFVISQACDSICFYASSDIPPETIRHLLLDQVVPRLLGQLGKLILHASAVELPNGKSVVFVGGSGWGKSTIASSFHSNGAKLITDDCLLVEEKYGDITVVANYYGIRLFKDSSQAVFGQEQQFSRAAHYSDKKRLSIKNKDPDDSYCPIKVEAIFILTDPHTLKKRCSIEVNLTTGIKGLMTLIEQMFVLDVSDKGKIIKHFQKTVRIVSTKVPVYELKYPREYASLPLVREAVIRKFEV